jgi:hypothetical protein
VNRVLEHRDDNDRVANSKDVAEAAAKLSLGG